MMVLPTTTVERLAVRPAAPAAPQIRAPHTNTGIVPPWLINGSGDLQQALSGARAFGNTGIVPPWMTQSIPTIMPSKG